MTFQDVFGFVPAEGKYDVLRKLEHKIVDSVICKMQVVEQSCRQGIGRLSGDAEKTEDPVELRKIHEEMKEMVEKLAAAKADLDTALGFAKTAGFVVASPSS